MAHQDIVNLGAGRLFARRAGEARERYLGDTLSATLSSSAVRLTVQSGDGSDATRNIIDRVVSVTHTLRLVLRNMDLENIELFVAGTGEDLDADAVADEAVAFASAKPASGGAGDAGLLDAALVAFAADVAAAATVQDVLEAMRTSGTGPGSAVQRLGPSPVGVPAVLAAGLGAKKGDGSDTGFNAAQVVNLAAAGTTMAKVRTAAASDDALLVSPADALVALLIHDPADSDADAMSDSATLKVSYTPAKARRVETGGADAVKSVAIRYKEDVDGDSAGEGSSVSLGRHLYFTSTTVSPDGEWPLKSRQEVQALPLTCVNDGTLFIDGVVK